MAFRGLFLSRYVAELNEPHSNKQKVGKAFLLGRLYSDMFVVYKDVRRLNEGVLISSKSNLIAYMYRDAHYNPMYNPWAVDKFNVNSPTVGNKKLESEYNRIINDADFDPQTQKLTYRIDSNDPALDPQISTLYIIYKRGVDANKTNYMFAAQPFKFLQPDQDNKARYMAGLPISEILP